MNKSKITQAFIDQVIEALACAAKSDDFPASVSAVMTQATDVITSLWNSRNEISIDTTLGSIVAAVTSDPMYPGIFVDLNDPAGALIQQLALVEDCPRLDEDGYEAGVGSARCLSIKAWTDPGNESYTRSFYVNPLPASTCCCSNSENDKNPVFCSLPEASAKDGNESYEQRYSRELASLKKLTPTATDADRAEFISIKSQREALENASRVVVLKATEHVSPAAIINARRDVDRAHAFAEYARLRGSVYRDGKLRPHYDVNYEQAINLALQDPQATEEMSYEDRYCALYEKQLIAEEILAAAIGCPLVDVTRPSNERRVNVLRFLEAGAMELAKQYVLSRKHGDHVAEDLTLAMVKDCVTFAAYVRERVLMREHNPPAQDADYDSIISAALTYDAQESKPLPIHMDEYEVRPFKAVVEDDFSELSIISGDEVDEDEAEGWGVYRSKWCGDVIVQDNVLDFPNRQLAEMYVKWLITGLDKYQFSEEDQQQIDKYNEQMDDAYSSVESYNAFLDRKKRSSVVQKCEELLKEVCPSFTSIQLFSGDNLPENIKNGYAMQFEFARGNEYVAVHCRNGAIYSINVTATSLSCLVQDIFAQLPL